MQTIENVGRSWPGQPQFQSISTPALATAFADALRRSPNRVFTTPAVLAELHGHLKSADGDFRESFWNAVVDMLSCKQVQECGDNTLIKWPPALRTRLGSHGPTDVGLLALGSDLLSTACDEAIIVTNESALRAEPGRLGLRRVTARDPLDLIREVLGPDAADG